MYCCISQSEYDTSKEDGTGRMKYEDKEMRCSDGGKVKLAFQKKNIMSGVWSA
jgi:hypothetical protein